MGLGKKAIPFSMLGGGKSEPILFGHDHGMVFRFFVREFIGGLIVFL